MPFAAYCKKCGNYLIGKWFVSIQGIIAKHFLKEHNQNPDPNIYRVDFNHDFFAYDAELETDEFRTYTFQSKVFDSQNYCIVVIIEKHFDYLQSELTGNPIEDNKTAELTLYPYFPAGYDSRLKK